MMKPINDLQAEISTMQSVYQTIIIIILLILDVCPGYMHAARRLEREALLARAHDGKGTRHLSSLAFSGM